jgi:hypothetical protein
MPPYSSTYLAPYDPTQSPGPIPSILEHLQLKGDPHDHPHTHESSRGDDSRPG